MPHDSLGVGLGIRVCLYRLVRIQAYVLYFVWPCGLPVAFLWPSKWCDHRIQLRSKRRITARNYFFFSSFKVSAHLQYTQATRGQCQHPVACYAMPVSNPIHMLPTSHSTLGHHTHPNARPQQVCAPCSDWSSICHRTESCSLFTSLATCSPGSRLIVIMTPSSTS